jgi:hypothetical protein
MIRFRCPNCDRFLQALADQTGSTAVCPGCSKPVQIPANTLPAAVAPARAAESQQTQDNPWDFSEDDHDISSVNPFRLGERELPAPPVEILSCKPLPKNCPTHLLALGAPLASFKQGFAYYLRGWLAWGWLAGIGLFLVFADRGFRWPEETRIIGFVLIALGSLSGIPHFLGIFRSPPFTLWICPGGIIWRRWTKIDGCAWHEVTNFTAGKKRHVAEVWLGPWIWWPMIWKVIGISWSYQYKVVCPRSSPFVFKSNCATDGVKSIGERIQFETTRALISLLRRRYQSGEPVWFSPFLLDRTCVHLGTSFIAWSELEFVTVTQDFVALHRCRGAVWQKLPFGEISHALVFIRLLEEILQASRTDQETNRKSDPFCF